MQTTKKPLENHGVMTGKLRTDIFTMRRMVSVHGGKTPVIKALTDKQKADVFDEWLNNHERALGNAL